MKDVAGQVSRVILEMGGSGMEVSRCGREYQLTVHYSTVSLRGVTVAM